MDTVMNTAINASNLQRFQGEFGDYIRRQAHSDDDTPPSRVGQLYQRLIFNNISGFINQCFPICRQITDDDAWHRLLLEFIKYGQMHSPYFSEINQQFVDYLQDGEIISQLNLPPFFAELAHYEWLELHVDNQPNTPPTAFLHHHGKSFGLNPSVQVVHYQWAVDKIGPDYLPDEPQETFVAVYRKAIAADANADNGDDSVSFETAFMSINLLGFIILTFIKECDKVYPNLDSLLSDIADYFNLPDEYLSDTASLFATLIDNQVLLHTA
ncbi:DUF2063 domain-containing protein [Moraxella sp. ZJ142]|uniref:HvfC family RiPP maturation protein n=1 Tax=Moraxella marmotae TaxID=3344520 RepID=UPI0035D47721